MRSPWIPWIKARFDILHIGYVNWRQLQLLAHGTNQINLSSLLNHLGWALSIPECICMEISFSSVPLNCFSRRGGGFNRNNLADSSRRWISFSRYFVKWITRQRPPLSEKLNVRNVICTKFGLNGKGRVQTSGTSRSVGRNGIGRYANTERWNLHFLSTF